MTRRRGSTARSSTRTSVSSSGRTRAATTVKLPGINVAWQISRAPAACRGCLCPPGRPPEEPDRQP